MTSLYAVAVFWPNRKQRIPIAFLRLLIFFSSSIMCLMVQAQSTEDGGSGKRQIKPLQIGAIVPDELWDFPLQIVNHPDGKETITLSEYRGKLIILDFWATWCSSCIAVMPRIHNLEKTHNSDMIMIPVTYEAADKVKLFLSNNKTVKPLGLYSVVEDITLNGVFQHTLIPHYVWISSDGKVLAMTSSDQVINENVETALAEHSSRIPSKIEINPERPLFLSDMLSLDDLTHYSVLTKSKYDGLPSGNRYRNQTGITRGRALTNTSIIDMYRTVAYRLLEKQNIRFNKKIFVIDSATIYHQIPNENLNGLVNYEIVVPLHLSDSLYDYMLKDLNKYTDYHGYMEDREVKCLILIKIGDLENIKSRGGKKENSLFYKQPAMFRNYTLSSLVQRLNDLPDIPLLVVNETDYSEYVDMVFHEGTNLDELRKDLNRQNLDLIEGYRTVKTFILKGKPKSALSSH